MPVDLGKKRQRRRLVQSISAWLTLNDGVKGDVGIISKDLYNDLFRRLRPQSAPSPEPANVRYIAISPWAPFSSESVSDSTWTILPVSLQENDGEEVFKLPPSTIAFSPSSLALQSFAEALQASPTTKGGIREKSGVEIQILDVEPLKLDTVYVTVDGDALNKHDEVQRKFGGGFNQSWTNGSTAKAKGKGKAPLPSKVNGASAASGVETQEHRLTVATRRALASAIVVRQGDLLPLPLPTHPITHVSLPPARIAFCEPVRQGLLAIDTEVVVSRVFHQTAANRTSEALVPRQILRGKIVEDDYDTSNEQFYSAVEDESAMEAPAAVDREQSPDSDSSAEDSGSLSEDSLENIISMATPGLLAEPSGFKSSALAATPRLLRPNVTGFDSPGSVYSNFTVTTAYQESGREERVFQTQSLLSKVSDDMLHPRPVSDEDEEARVFVDIKMLLKIGCFSGDWVKVEGVRKSPHGQHEQWGINTFVDDGGFKDEFRPVKVYGLPDLSRNTKAQNPSGNATNRQPNMIFGSALGRSTATAWFSPIFLLNLKNPSHVKLSPFFNSFQEKKSFGSKNDRSNVSTPSMPHVAREVTLSRILTPVSTERALQSGLMAALTHHFEYKRRILRKGDLVPLAVDVGILRMLSQPTTTPDADREIEELISTTSNEPSQYTNTQNVAWFRVSQIINSVDDKDVHTTSVDNWGGVSCIEPMITRTVQARNEQCKAPSTLNNSWNYYLGIKSLPKLHYYSKPLSDSFRYPPRPPLITPLKRRLRELMAAATSPQAVHLGMDPTIILLHSTQRKTGKARLTKYASSDIGLHVFEIDAYELLTEGGSGGGDLKTEILFKARMERAMSCGNSCTTVLVRHIEALTADRMVSAITEAIKDIRVLVATTTELNKVPEGLRSLFTHELEFSAPDEAEREGILKEVVEERSVRLAHDVDLASVALKTAALVAGDLLDIVERAVTARQDRLEVLITKALNNTNDPIQVLIRDVVVSGGEGVLCLTKADFDVAVDAARKNFADSIGAPKIPSVSWEDVGGLENVKEAVMETIQLPLERPEFFAKGMKKRSGILFYGPPGTGKTLLAKAIATEFSLNFFSVKGPEMLNMYIGESEANVRRVFQRARDARPCVVFFDELDSVAPKRGNQGDSGGVMDRIVSQLLAELDGMSEGEEGRGGVFVIGATNRPDLLDQALLRPGRFDKMLYLGVSDSHEKQLTILNALTRKFTLEPNLSLPRVANSLPFTYTGADLYALCSDAMLKAITRQASAVDAKIKSLPGDPITTAYFFDHLATEDDIAVMVTEDDFSAAQKELVGSVR